MKKTMNGSLQGWKTHGSRDVDLKKLVELYKDTAKISGDRDALIASAEAIASETTAIQNPAAEATAFVSAQAIAQLAKGGK